VKSSFGFEKEKVRVIRVKQEKIRFWGVTLFPKLPKMIFWGVTICTPLKRILSSRLKESKVRCRTFFACSFSSSFQLVQNQKFFKVFNID
jgi:hypothetical protein